jgi:multiple sugar transport system substrate-binding protein
MAAMKRRNGLWAAMALVAAAGWLSCTSQPPRKKVNTGDTGGEEETGGSSPTGGYRGGAAGSGGKGGDTGGAGGGGAGGATIVLKMMWWGSPTRADLTNKAAQMFEAKHPGIKIETMSYATTQGTNTVGMDYWPTLNDLAAKNQLPDIMQQDYAYIGDWTGRSLLQPLDAFIADGTIKLADVPQGFVDGGKVSGKVMAISLGTNTQAIAIDVDLFTKLSLPIPGDDWTWEDFENIAQQITMKAGIYGAGSGIWGYTPGWKSIYLSLGQWVFSADGKSLGYTDDQPWIDHFNMLLRLKKAGALPGIMDEPMMGNVESLLMVTKKSGMEHIFSNQLVGMSAAATAANMNVPRKFKLLPLPKVKGQKSPIYMKPSQYLAITANSTHAKEAAQVIDFFTNDIDANKILRGERGVPINTKVLAALKADLDPDSAESFDLIQRGAAYATKLPPNDPPPWTAILNGVFTPTAKEIINEQLTPEAGVAYFRRNASALLAGQTPPDGGVAAVDAAPDDGGPNDGGAPDDSGMPNDSSAPDGGAVDAPPSDGHILLVTGNLPDGTDMQIQARLQQHWMVDQVSEMVVTTGDAAGKAAVVITASAGVLYTGTKFKDVTTPVLLMEPNLLGMMGMTGDAPGNHGTVANQTQVTIVGEAASPLVAGHSGNVSVYAAPYRMVYGVPSGQATKVATVLNQPTQVAIFAYEAGAQMVTGTAPGKRLSFFAHNNAATMNITEDGLRLLDAAVEWLLSQ